MKRLTDICVYGFSTILSVMFIILFVVEYMNSKNPAESIPWIFLAVIFFMFSLLYLIESIIRPNDASVAKSGGKKQ